MRFPISESEPEPELTERVVAKCEVKMGGKPERTESETKPASKDKFANAPLVPPRRCGRN